MSNREKEQAAEIERLKEILAISGRAHDTAVEKWGQEKQRAEAAEAKVKELEKYCEQLLSYMRRGEPVTTPEPRK